LKPLILIVRVKGMKKIDDKKIKGISIELDRSTKLNELDDTINEFKEKTDDKHELDVRIDILNSTLHMKRLKKPHLKLATKDGKKIKQKDEILVKHIDDKD
jgi:Holliday junction resolvase-like predicted endonuclease